MTPEKEEKMSYYKTCPHCGAHLDPGGRDKERAAQGATNTQDGETEHVDHAASTSIMNETEEKVK